MVDTLTPSFDRPTPGMSLTAELGNRPWQQPPQYSTVEEALQWYIPRLTNPELLDQLLDVMESGIPLTTIVSLTFPFSSIKHCTKTCPSMPASCAMSG